MRPLQEVNISVIKNNITQAQTHNALDLRGLAYCLLLTLLG